VYYLQAGERFGQSRDALQNQIKAKALLLSAFRRRADVAVLTLDYRNRLGLFDTCPCVEKTHRTAPV